MEENSQELKRADYIIGIITLLIIVLLLGLSVLMFLETRSLQDELAEEQQINIKLANDILWLQEYYELMEEIWALEAETGILEARLEWDAEQVEKLVVLTTVHEFDIDYEFWLMRVVSRENVNGVYIYGIQEPDGSDTAYVHSFTLLSVGELALAVVVGSNTFILIDMENS